MVGAEKRPKKLFLVGWWREKKRGLVGRWREKNIKKKVLVGWLGSWPKCTVASDIFFFDV